MPANLQSIPIAFGPAYIRSGKIFRVMPNRTYRIRMEGGSEITAVAAMTGSMELAAGHRVLVAGESPTSGYIIGLLEEYHNQSLQTASGAGANISGEGDEQIIAVYDAHHRTLFEYHSATGQSVIHATEGDLRLAAPNGRIELQAAKGIHCSSEEAIDIHGRQRVRISAEGRMEKAEQVLDLNQDGARIGVHRMNLTAGQGDFTVARAVYHGQSLRSSVDRAKMVYGKLETTARKIWQRSGYFLLQVQHLCQTRAGRMRTHVKGALHSQSGRATLIAEEDVRIDGRKINLG